MNAAEPGPARAGLCQATTLALALVAPAPPWPARAAWCAGPRRGPALLMRLRAGVNLPPLIAWPRAAPAPGLRRSDRCRSAPRPRRADFAKWHPRCARDAAHADDGKPLPSVARSARITVAGSSTGRPTRPRFPRRAQVPCRARARWWCWWPPRRHAVAHQGGGDHGDLVFVQVGRDFFTNKGTRRCVPSARACCCACSRRSADQQAVERCVALQARRFLVLGLMLTVT